MTRFVVACFVACWPVLSAVADDPKPDVAKLKDEIKVLETDLGLWKAKVTGAEKTVNATKELLDKLSIVAAKSDAAIEELVAISSSYNKFVTDLDVVKAEVKVAEVKLNQAKRRLAVAEKVAEKPEKTYAVSFTNTPRAAVFDWLANESGLVYIVKEKPTGSFTLKSIAGKKYTLTELIDLFNESMAPQFVLVRGEKSFTVIPADEKLDGTLFPTIELRDLGNYGKTEIVQALVPIPAELNTDTTVKQLKTMLSPFGLIEPLGKSHLLIRDRAGIVSRTAKDLDSIRSQGR